jgi:hypothetical protein
MLAAISPHLKAMFTSGMAESTSREVTLHEVDGVALGQIIDCAYMYSGKIDLSGPSAMKTIKTANYLHVDAVAEAAVQFVLEGLD